MRYRAWTASGDYTFGQGPNAFLVNSPQAVAQAIVSRLRLLMIRGVGEWFVNTADGTPWDTQVFGYNTGGTRDLVVQQRILGTTGVLSIASFQSYVNRQTRTYYFQCAVNTIYGQIPFASSSSTKGTQITFA